MKQKQVYLILTTGKSLVLTQHYEAINTVISKDEDCFLLYHLKDGEVLQKSCNAPYVTFTNELVTGLTYFPIGFNLIPGNNHFPLLDFYLKNPNYDYYWVIEDDVRFNGSWQTFFQAFATVDKDFISCHVRTSDEEPHWHWWASLANAYQVVPFNKRIRSFNPIYRISGQALAFIHSRLCEGWCGHHEVFFPTLLSMAGYTIADFGGDGHFVLPGFQNRFYTSGPNNKNGNLEGGTMRWRPVFKKVGERDNMLYHPVKE